MFYETDGCRKCEIFLMGICGFPTQWTRIGCNDYYMAERQSNFRQVEKTSIGFLKHRNLLSLSLGGFNLSKALYRLIFCSTRYADNRNGI